MTRLYHGWYVLGIGGLAGVLAAGSSQMFLGSILPFMTAETGWSHSAITGAIFTGTLLGGLFAPVAGMLNDRHGPRLLLPVAAVALGTAYLTIASAQSLAAFYVGYAIARVAAQGTLNGAIVRTIPVRWFQRYRGRAMGFITMAVPLGAATVAMVAQGVIAAGYGWRATCYALGCLTLLLLVVPGWLVLREGPEAMGLMPDGSPADAAGAAAGFADPAEDWSVAEAYRSPVMWLLVAATVLGIGANGAMIFFHVTYLVGVGLEPLIAVASASTLALFGALANLGWGFLAERFSERWLAIISQCGAAVLILTMLQVTGPVSALIVALGLGVMIRGESSLISLIVARYFGRRSYGGIIGFLTSFQLIGLGSGPLLGSLLLEATGSYRALYAAISITYAVTALLFMLCRTPDKPASADSA